MNANNNAAQPANQPANQAANQPANLNNIFNNLGVNFQSLVASTLRQYPRRMPVQNQGSIAYRRSRFPFPSVTDLANWALANAIKRELVALQTSVVVLRRTVDVDEETSTQVHASLKQAAESILKLERLLQIILDAIPIEARPNAASAVKAQKVFDVAELLEKILLNCEYHDFISAMQVNRTFAQAFRRSARIQQVMGLRAITDGSPFSPVANAFFVSRGCMIRLEDHHRYGHQVQDNEVVVSAIFNGSSPFEEHPLPRISERFRDTLVCQPPIKQMRVRAGCCEDPLFRRRNANNLQPHPPSLTSLADRDEEMQQLHSIDSETGITLGQVLDETRRLRDEHRYCPDAYPGLHRDDGTVDVHVHFEAILQLPRDDPVLLANRRAKASFDFEQKDFAAKDQKIQQYIAAKQSARDNGEPIPTLQEFEARSLVTNVEDHDDAEASNDDQLEQ
ncbi:hypothetical protein M409DRAFT_50090 [Zasmidium cellare ATCC 36951]|uniref:Uncharacterized protein n=1 Tax=Zasmidium cellare ATCC 36951 TaxID=1080233 RepID=A0A6A6D2I4_ZASCE|nr:uncharacterized protein M409DRAFT_50090 [Zasmidium cellare ATCC 36951]KAF2172382.1 hypothetical protein M409DRAFT_50090 [Zasmidium cellare ATCC 36951]